MNNLNKFVDVPTILNNLKTKVDDFDIGKLKKLLVNLKKLSDVVDSEVVKNTNFSALKTKVNKLDKKFLDATTLIHNTDKETDKETDNKIHDHSGLVKKNRF